jgi:hypothetical protein
MTELIERYVHQVGRYLPPKERAEIEAELRSQIQDQLDDRYAGSPTQEEAASVLAEFGHPYEMAASYSSEKYLVGPLLYPYMMLVLRYVWLLVPTIVIFLNLFGALVSPPGSLLALFIETLWAVLQTVLIVSAIVVLFFAIMQHSGTKFDEQEAAFNPLDLPEVDDPHSVDRFETVSGLAIGTIMTLALLYFLRVGGLTLRFDLNDPGDVIPFPQTWMVLLLITVVAEVIMHLLALRRNRWSVSLWLVEAALEVFGIVCLYFAVLQPVVERIATDNPALAQIPLGTLLEIGIVIAAVTMLIDKGSRLVRLWAYSGIETHQSRSNKGEQR